MPKDLMQLLTTTLTLSGTDSFQMPVPIRRNFIRRDIFLFAELHPIRVSVLGEFLAAIWVNHVLPLFAQSSTSVVLASSSLKRISYISSAVMVIHLLHGAPKV